MVWALKRKMREGTNLQIISWRSNWIKMISEATTTISLDVVKAKNQIIWESISRRTRTRAAWTTTETTTLRANTKVFPPILSTLPVTFSSARSPLTPIISLKTPSKRNRLSIRICSGRPLRSKMHHSPSYSSPKTLCRPFWNLWRQKS